MNLPNTWQGVANSPIIIALVVLTGATILVVFLAPLFFNLLKQIKFPKKLEFIKRYPRRSLAAILVILILAFFAYLFYYFNQPVRIVTAAQFKLEKGRQIEKLQQEGLGAWEKVGMYLLDIRMPDEYSVEHLKASASLPAEKVGKETYPGEKLDIVIYSTASRFKESRQVASLIKKNSEAVKRNRRSKVGKVYIIKDGFEGLKKAGLITETGVYD